MKLLVFVTLCLLGSAHARIGWRGASNGQVPIGAFVAGNLGGNRLYYCRAFSNGHLIGGHLEPSQRACTIGQNDREFRNANYDVAIGNTEVWRQITRAEMVNNVPRNAVIVGFTTNRMTIYGCRVTHQGHLLPGRVGGGICSVSDRGLEFHYHTFFVLLDSAI